MIKYKVYNQEAEVIGEQDLSEKIFGVAINEGLVHQALIAQLANARRAIADTKDRGEVRGGGRKPWRQKGTGRARAGSNRSPLWIGGGITFGPTRDRNFSQKINKKMASRAICMVLSDRLATKNLIIVDNLTVPEGKTKALKQIVDKLLAAQEPENVKKNSRVLILTTTDNEPIKLASHNLPRLQVINDQNINIVSLLRAPKLIIAQPVVDILQVRYGQTVN